MTCTRAVARPVAAIGEWPVVVATRPQTDIVDIPLLRPPEYVVSLFDFKKGVRAGIRRGVGALLVVWVELNDGISSQVEVVGRDQTCFDFE